MSSSQEDSSRSNDADEVVDFMQHRSKAAPPPNMALIDVEGVCYASYRVEQYAQDVVDFSSQYGSDYSISYTAPNITGRPSKFPEYGDFPESFAMVRKA